MSQRSHFKQRIFCVLVYKQPRANTSFLAPRRSSDKHIDRHASTQLRLERTHDTHEIKTKTKRHRSRAYSRRTSRSDSPIPPMCVQPCGHLGSHGPELHYVVDASLNLCVQPNGQLGSHGHDLKYMRTRWLLDSCRVSSYELWHSATIIYPHREACPH